MRTILRQIILFIFTLIVWILISRVQVFAQYRIMITGDSNTVGKGDPDTNDGSPFNGYRDDLYFLLTDNGWQFDFVGTQNHGESTLFDTDHEGYNGWRAYQASATIIDLLDINQPNVVLLHIGTNDISQGEAPPNIRDEIEGILNKINSYDPEIIVLLCKIIPRLENDDNDHLRTEELNVLIEQLFFKKKEQDEFNIYLVDQHSPFVENENWRTEYMYDPVHPNTVGFHLFAVNYFEALQKVNFSGGFYVDVIVNPEGSGAVQKFPLKNNYFDGEEISITATPENDFSFSNWSGDISESDNNPLQVMVSRDLDIVANFTFSSGEFISIPEFTNAPSAGLTGDLLSFTATVSINAIGHDLEYQYDWGDGQTTEWASATATHVYDEKGTFFVKVRARCTNHTDIVTAWSGLHSVNIGVNIFKLDITVIPENVGIVNYYPIKERYDYNETVVLPAVPLNINGELNGNIYIESETGTLSGNFGVQNIQTEADVFYLFGTQGIPMDGTAEYTFDVQQAGDYVIWGRCYALSQYMDSFFMEVDENEQIITWHLEQTYDQWVWQKVTDDRAEKSFYLTAGTHKIKIIKRDINVRIDKLILTRDNSFTPEGKEDGLINLNTHTFSHWSGDLTGSENPAEIEMTESLNITAYFRTPSDEIVTTPDQPAGPDSGYMGQPLTYSTGGSTSSEGNDVEYQFDWENGSISLWGNNIQEHTYASAGIKKIRARARSIGDTLALSGWSNYFETTITHDPAETFALTIIVDPTGSGTVTVTPLRDRFIPNEQVILTASSNTGFAFDFWGGDLTGNENPKTIVMDTNKVITARFVTADENVTTPAKPTGPIRGQKNSNLIFTTGGAISNFGHEVEYQFDWGDGDLSNWGSSEASHSYLNNGNFQVKARARCKTHSNVISDWSDSLVVVIADYILNVTLNPPGAGRIIKIPDNTSYVYGEQVELFAQAEQFYRFEYWSGDISGASNPAIITLLSDKEIVANFVQTDEVVNKPEFITAQDSGVVGESIQFVTGSAINSVGNPVEYQFDWGDTTISTWGDSALSHSYNSPGKKYVIARARSATYTSIISQWSDSIEVNILGDYYKIFVTLNPTNGGSVNLTPNKIFYENGNTVVLSSIPAEGYVFESWSGDVSGIDNPVYVTIDNNLYVTTNFRIPNTVTQKKQIIPDKFALLQNYPNPFNPETTINYQLPKTSYIKITIYNVQGQLIKTLLNQKQSAGYYQLKWNATDSQGDKLPSGLYLCRLETQGFVDVKKMVLMR
jgi:lysophospholipase L1-like esterase